MEDLQTINDKCFSYLTMMLPLL